MAQSNADKYDINWSDYFYYDETSPSCLRWKVDVKNGRGLKHTRRQAGDVAGSVGGKRYWHVMFNWKDYAVHRIIWKILKGSLDGMYIDHIDGDSTNNKIENLRLATLKTNSRNKKKQINNSTGVSGVSCISNGKGVYYWCASWRTLDMKQAQKCFSIREYGLMPAFKMAVEYRLKMIKELNEQGADYSERHGT
jgi:hypothetical protein